MFRSCAWRGRRHGPCVHGGDRRRARRPRHRDAALSIPLHGTRQQAAGHAGCCACRGAGSGREAAQRCPKLPLIAGGKSFGGRMTSQAQASTACPACAASCFSAFRCTGWQTVQRARGAPRRHPGPDAVPAGDARCAGGTDLLEPVVKRLGKPATLHLLEEADHSFHVLASSGRNDREMMAEALDAFAAWVDMIAGRTTDGGAPRRV